MANSVGLHEAEDRLDRATMDRHRALTSLQEELEAIDWYDQRIDAAEDAELKQILAHNRDEEKEHAAMTIEWLRRRDSALDEHLRTYLFTTGSIVGLEKEAESDDGEESSDSSGSLGIGSLKGPSSKGTR
jgi:ferritin-like protein